MSQALIRFPGITKTLGGVVTISSGPFPSAALIYFLPQPSISLSPGDLTITQDGTTVTLTDCQPEMATLRSHKQGDIYVQSILIMDRRHKWQKSRITKDYNKRLSDGEVMSASKLDASSLCSALLAACGETQGSSDIPNDAYPEVSWVSSNPAYELDKLCDDFGCDIILNESSVDIKQRYSGSQLPTDGPREMIPDYEFEASNGPQYFTVDYGPTLWDGNLELEPVALESNGTYVAIDSASYMPSGGWSKQHPMAMPGVAAASRPLALSSVHRVFRIKGLAKDGLTIPIKSDYVGATNGSFSVASASQIKALGYRLQPAGQYGEKRQATVVGKYWNRSEAFSRNEDWQEIDVGFTIDTENGLVIFDDFVCQLTSGCFEEAELYLKTAFNVELDSGSIRREEYTTSRAGIRTSAQTQDTLCLPREELQIRYTLGYNEPDTPTGANPIASHNITTINTEAAAWVNAMRAPFSEDRTQKVMMYEGIKNISLDGKIRQVTYELSHLTDGVARTIASENYEHEIMVATHNERKKSREALR